MARELLILAAGKEIQKNKTDFITDRLD